MSRLAESIILTDFKPNVFSEFYLNHGLDSLSLTNVSIKLTSQPLCKHRDESLITPSESEVQQLYEAYFPTPHKKFCLKCQFPRKWCSTLPELVFILGGQLTIYNPPWEAFQSQVTTLFLHCMKKRQGSPLLSHDPNRCYAVSVTEWPQGCFGLSKGIIMQSCDNRGPRSFLLETGNSVI